MARKTTLAAAEKKESLNPDGKPLDLRTKKETDAEKEKLSAADAAKGQALSKDSAPDAPKKAKEAEKRVEEPLGPGEAYFDAPDGHSIIGDATKGHIWYRNGNHGKGCWINRRR